MENLSEPGKLDNLGRQRKESDFGAEGTTCACGKAWAAGQLRTRKMGQGGGALQKRMAYLHV